MATDGKPGGLDRNRDFDDVETLLQDTNDDVVESSISPRDGSKARGFANLDEFVQSLIEIGVIKAAELEPFASDSAEDVLGLSRALVKAGKLTPYQAAAVYQKKSRGLLIGEYVILQKLGQGGMGVVFKARHRQTGRVGALKILPPSFARDHGAVLRFRREIEAAGRLKHLNVVAAIDSDEDRGVHFLVMDYVEGRDLDRVIRTSGPMQIGQAVDCLIQAARGLEAAHEQGIVHRDIKPGNLMLDLAGTVRVLDLGLARIVDANNPFNKTTAGRLTQSGMYMGTVDFMAPEQAEDAHRVDHRADIYSLGCTLYFLLTGREPFPAETLWKRMKAHIEHAAPSLRTARPDVPVTLEACYQKMMAKDPSDRPRSMTEVIALLQASKLPPDEVTPRRIQTAETQLMTFDEGHLKRAAAPKTKPEPSIFARPNDREGLAVNHELNLEDLVIDVRSDNPVAAHKPRKTTIEPRFRASTPALRSLSRQDKAGLIALAATTLIVAGLVGFVVSRPPTPLIENENDSQVSEPEPSASVQPAELATPRPPVPPKKTIFDGTSGRGWMLCNRSSLPPFHIQTDGINPHGTGSYLVVYDQKLGDFVLDFDYKLAQGSNTGVFLRVSDLKDPVKTGIEVAIDDVRRGGDRDSGAFCGLVAPTTYAQKPTGEWNHMTITADGPRIAVSLNGTEVSSINLDLWTLPGKRPDGSHHGFDDLVVANLARSGYLGFQDLGGDCWFKNIVLQNGAGRSTSRESLNSVASRPLTWPVTESEPADATYVETARFGGHKHNWVEGISILPDGRSALTSCYDKTVRLWDLATGREVRKFWHPAGLRPVVACPDGRRAVTGCTDGIVRLWDLQTGQVMRELARHIGNVPAVALSPDGTLVLSGGDDKTLRLINVDTAMEVRRFEGQIADVASVAFSADGNRILAGGGDGVVRFAQLQGSEPLHDLPGHSGRIWAVIFSAASRYGIASSEDGALTCWDLDTKRVLRQTKLPDAIIRCTALDPDGRHVIFGGALRSVKVASKDGFLGTWDFTSNDAPRTTPGSNSHLGLALLPDNALATADNGGLVRVWRRSHSLAAARALVGAGDPDAALADYQRALTARPDDARLLIERGRLLLTLGRGSEADSDLARAAQLAPDNPQLFLDAGWWVAGPYAADLNVKTPIEQQQAPDPSMPPPPSGDKPRTWRPVAPEMLGFVDLKRVIEADNVAAYALAVIFCQSEKPVTLLAGSDDAARIWLNGKLELEIASATGADSRAVAATLKPGRNTILVKVANVAGEYGFHLRISDEPECLVNAFYFSEDYGEASQAYKRVLRDEPTNSDPWTHHYGAESLAQLGRWKEAIDGFKIALALNPQDSRARDHLMNCYIALGDAGSYRPICKGMIESLRKDTNAETINHMVRMASLMQGALVDYASVLNAAKKQMDQKAVLPQHYQAYGMLLFRAKQYQSAINFLKRSIEAREARKEKQDLVDWLFLAMARHELKLPTANDAYKRAVALSKTASSDWESKAQIHGLFDETKSVLGVP